MKNKILIIEDDPVIMDAISVFLKEEGFEPFIAQGGVEGIQKAIEILPDLIISDVAMPGKNGYEVCKTLQSIPDTSTIPFIFLTARVQRDDLRLGMQMGADDYLTKPFDYSELLKCIKVRLEKHHRYINQSDEKFYALIDNPFDRVYIYADDKFTYINSKLSEITGFNKDEMMAMGFENLINKIEENKESLEKIDKCIKGISNSVTTELKIIRKDKIISGIELFGIMVKIKGKECMMGNIIEKYSNRITEPMGKKPGKPLLSKREKGVLQLVCQGMPSDEIAKIINLSQRTIDAHRRTLLAKTKSRNTAELVMWAVRYHLVEL